MILSYTDILGTGKRCRVKAALPPATASPASGHTPRVPGFFCAVNAAAIAPKRVYTTRDAAIAAAEKDGWTVTIDTLAASLGRKGGKAKTPAKSAAAKRRENSGLAAGRKAIAALTPEQRRENARKAAKARWAKTKNEKKEE